MADLGVGQLASQATGYLTGLAQTGIGLWDRMRGEKKLKEAQSFYEKNKYQIPESAKAALGVAQRQASTLRMPGEDIARSRLGETTSRGVGAAQQAATSSSDVLTMLSQLMGQQAQGEQDIAFQGAQRYDRQQANVQQELGRMSDLERERWQYNVLAPAQQMFAQAEALQTRGTQEMSAGLGAIGGTAASGTQMAGAEQRFADFKMGMFGEQWQPSTMAGANMQRNAVRQNLPSYNMEYPDTQLRF